MFQDSGSFRIVRYGQVLQLAGNLSFIIFYSILARPLCTYWVLDLVLGEDLLVIPVESDLDVDLAGLGLGLK